MGHVVKVVLWFRSAFWERLQSGRYRDAAFFRCDGPPFPTFWTQVPVRSELVVAWAGGPKTVTFRGAAEDAIIASALECFGRLFRDPDLARAQFVAGFMHDWTPDPFARGAYSYLRVGGAGAREALAAPAEDTLFFAGEATSTNGQAGTVNGALETGERAADEAAAALGITAGRSRHG
jgi:monoamine oxidase